MKIIQYTVRNIPEPVNRYLRKRARLSGKSLNQTIIDELSARVAEPTENLGTALAWFIGSGMDDETYQALKDVDTEDKRLSARDL